MAVPEQTPYKEYTANGSTTSFALGFICDSKNDLIVLVDNVAPPVATWSLVGNNAVFTTAPASGKKIILQRQTKFERTTSFQSNNNSFRPETINKDIDRVWLKLQELGVADYLLRLYVDLLHNDQKTYIDQQDKVLRDNLNNLSEQVELKDNELQQNINNLGSYVDDQDDELRSYLMGEISKQGVALDQLEDYYNYLMQRLSQIASDKGWDASFVRSANGQNQQQINDYVGADWYSKPFGYNVGDRVRLADGSIAVSIIPGNTNNPNLVATGWVSASQLVVDSIATLRTKTGMTGQIAYTLSYHAGIPGGGASYRWVGGTEDNGFNKINGWELIFTGEIDVRCGGAKVNLPVIENQTAVISTVTEQVNALGGGIVHFPAGTFYASVRAQSNVEIRGKINIDMTPATKIQAFWSAVGNDGANILADKPFFKAKSFELDGSYNGVPGGITGLRVTSYGCKFENIVSHSSRYDGMAISGNNANFNTFTKCVFRHCKRNVVSYTAGHDNTFIECQFIEDINVWGEALYLFDIEPNDSNGIWYNVTFKSCVFERVTQTANGAVFFEQKEVNPQRQLNITFDDCHFKGYAVIQPRGPYNIKGFKLINSRFDHIAFASAGASFYNIESGEIRGNSFSTQLLSYRINILGDVILSDNHFRGPLSPQVTDTATFRKNTFTGVTAIAPINRTSGIGTAAGRNVSESVNTDIPSNSLIRKSFGLRYVDRQTLTNFDYNTLTAGEYVFHQTSTGQLNAPPNPYVSLYVMRNYQDDNQLTVVGHDYYNGGLITRGKNNGNWSGWAKHYHTLNTTVDANGFIKAASPIVRMFADGIEVNEEAALQDISFEKLGVGDYLLKGSTGFAQEGWYIETPKDANGNVLFSVVYTTLENGDISVKTYKKKFDLELAAIVADLDNPVDITESRWIDLRLHEVQEILDMPAEPEEIEPIEQEELDQIEPIETQS